MTTSSSPSLNGPSPPLIDEPSRPVSFNRLILALVVAGAALGLVGVLLDIYLKWPIEGVTIPFIGTIKNLTHPSGEASIYSWYSTLMLSAVAVGFVVIALAKWRTGKLPWQYLVMAATAFLLSADEAALLHEKMWEVSARLGIGWTWTYSWLLAAVPLAALVGVVLVWIARTIDPVLRRRLIFAGVLFFLGAVGVESIGGMLESNRFNLEPSAQFLLFNLSMLAEESLELAGAIVAFWATLAYLQVVRGPDGLTVSVRDSAS